MNVEATEFKKAREKLGLTQLEMAHLLGFSGGRSQTVKNIEGGFRKPSGLAIKLLRYLASLPKNKAAGLIEELNRHDAN